MSIKGPITSGIREYVYMWIGLLLLWIAVIWAILEFLAAATEREDNEKV